MLGGHHHIFLACLFRQLGPGSGGVGFRRKAAGQLGILVHGDSLIFHSPLVAAAHAVETPVDEHSEAGFVPPAHAPLAIGIAFGRAGGARRGHGRRGTGSQQSEIVAS